MQQICDPDLCSGCSACLNICPRDAISMVEDELGALHPVISVERCIDCKLCEKVCPVHTSPEFRQPLSCFAAHVGNRTDADRRICASGGVATAFSRYAIRQKGGVVYGVCWDADFSPVVCRVDKEEDLEKLKGSKYVQAGVGLSYRQIKSDLSGGIFVLFVGTPCQIAGLNNFLRKPYPNLLTVDLICHGVCPTSYWDAEVGYLRSKRSFDRITDIRFRGNDRQNFRLSFWENDRLAYSRPAYGQPYFSGFLKAVSLRENCYRCAYAQPARISDLTIGDFIGLGIDQPYPHPYKTRGNASVVLANTKEGLSFYEDVLRFIPGLCSVERPYSEAVKYGPSLREPFPHHALTQRFRTLYLRIGYVRAIRKVLWRSVLYNRIIASPVSYLWRIPRKACRILKERM